MREPERGEAYLNDTLRDLSSLEDLLVFWALLEEWRQRLLDSGSGKGRSKDKAEDGVAVSREVRRTR